MAQPITPAMLMDLPDDILVRIIRAKPVSEGSLDFITQLKTTNDRLLTLVRIEMQLDKEYSEAVHDLFFLHHVKGTRIPCNAEHVPALSEPDDTQDVLQLFESTKSGKDVLVSGIFSDEYYHGLHFWEDLAPTPEELEIEVPPKRSFYLMVEIKFSPPLVRMLADGTADLSQVPNVMRSVLLGDSDLHVDYAHYEEMDGTTFSYMRMLRIQEDHTMNDVISTVRDIEGKAISANGDIEDDTPFCNVSVSNSGLFNNDESYSIPIPQLLALIDETEFDGNQDNFHATFYWNDERDN